MVELLGIGTVHGRVEMQLAVGHEYFHAGCEGFATDNGGC